MYGKAKLSDLVFPLIEYYALSKPLAFKDFVPPYR